MSCLCAKLDPSLCGLTGVLKLCIIWWLYKLFRTNKIATEHCSVLFWSYTLKLPMQNYFLWMQLNFRIFFIYLDDCLITYIHKVFYIYIFWKRSFIFILICNIRSIFITDFMHFLTGTALVKKLLNVPVRVFLFLIKNMLLYGTFQVAYIHL